MSPCRHAGNPVRPEILSGQAESGRRQFGLTSKKPVLLIIGGGTGSAAINTLIGAMARKLVLEWTVIHVTGK
ncbi:MAG: UDP-N-acetylglucosamine--N-acetylmuramyl-(pentapeptide) pyrophosphoryl-undecaprenol N-acetylglucosamine transferase, partial [Pseudomonadota bacterium]